MDTAKQAGDLDWSPDVDYDVTCAARCINAATDSYRFNWIEHNAYYDKCICRNRFGLSQANYTETGGATYLTRYTGGAQTDYLYNYDCKYNAYLLKQYSSAMATATMPSTPFSFPSRSSTPSNANAPQANANAAPAAASSVAQHALERRPSHQHVRRPSQQVVPHGAARDNASSMTQLAAKAGPEESLRQYKLLEALRSGTPETITPLLQSASESISKRRQEPGSEAVPVSTPLHTAVRIAKHNVVDLVLKHDPSWLNAQDVRGQTPLHLAAGLNRTDVVAMFLLQDSVDDSIRDVFGKTAIESAGGPDVSTLMTVSRAHHNEKYLSLLAAYVHSSTSASETQVVPPSPKIEAGSATQAVSAASGHVSNIEAERLYHFLAKPKSSCVHFAAKEPKTGTTLLHEAVRRKDLGLIKLAIARGADVVARDKKGKLPIDLAKDDRIKTVLRQAAADEGRALKQSSAESGAPILGQPPAMKGYLSKWTNVARGYRSRWFVLDNGVLSYYRTQEDEGKASRGSINMGVAHVTQGSDKLKFSIENKLGKSFPSFYLKGNHPVEVMRWVDILRQNVDFAREGAYITRTRSGASSYAPSVASLSITDKDRRGSEFTFRGVEPSTRSSPADSIAERDPSFIADDETFNEDGDQVPRAEDFDLLAQGAKTQLEHTQQLLNSLIVTDSAAGNSRQTAVKDALKGALHSLGTMLDEYVDVVHERERFFVRKYEREIDAKRMWEENMKEVAAQQQAMEAELQKAARDSTRRKRALQEVRMNLAASPQILSPDTAAFVDEELRDAHEAVENGKTDSRSSSQTQVPTLSVDTTKGTRSRASTVATAMSPSRVGRLRSGTTHTLTSQELAGVVESALAGSDDEVSSDTDDEFFEAIETGQLPITEEDDSTDKQIVKEQTDRFLEKYDMSPYKGYDNLRHELPIKSDDRPPVSLWAILKGSIGKDLTKISFPVYFNEPCSMLQRMAEDIEFSECLDAAASDPDSTKRVAYVAAFAMSNYSSTIGRIAKPFNPMLGETFEYVSPEKKYRYISEQVSHHPPISACIAQSPTWEYFGEVDAKSKFLGKSFEIRPTGVAHVNLRIPKEWAPNLPPAGDRFPDMVVEHYSWTKVTTVISNFLFGNPIIDHYGDMVVTNHQTKDTCTLTFKPRGWRGSGAMEIKGKVVDSRGKDCWDIAGKWSSQLVARRVGAGSGDLAPDATVPTNGKGEVSAEYIRLWKNSEKPPGAPFNLTPFAITLNDDNQELRKWLPPTDCRLRPDQHAFEKGNFEHANTLKSELEEHQRATRRLREAGKLPPHKPRWFKRSKDEDTGEGFWEPSKTQDGLVEYWEERLRVGQKRLQEGKTDESWKDVDPIFGDFQ
ncbi:hypothetical protein OIV83_001185 [Microbotryomycetes sp. JL201]|nr:hypothetical protein OIV83_001185 [Microbotryomycetes sp. JL201]